MHRFWNNFLVTSYFLSSIVLIAMASSLSPSGREANTGGIKCLFSDIDGTLVHYYETEEDGPTPGPPEVIALPPSKTGRQAHISRETLVLASRIRAKGTRLVLISGVRYSTFAARLPFLPRADAYVIENGGRIFYPPSCDEHSREIGVGGDETEDILPPTGHLPEDLVEDMEWRQQLAAACGPPSQDALPPAERKGPLWDVYRQLIADGYDVDTATYYTMIRVKLNPSTDSKGSEYLGLRTLLGSLPPGLRAVTNFGLVDICPEQSGKLNSGKHLASAKFDVPLELCASMGDDDNDVDIANAVGKGAFITGFSSQSIADAAAKKKKHFRVAKTRGVLAAEEMLRLLLDGC